MTAQHANMVSVLFGCLLTVVLIGGAEVVFRLKSLCLDTPPPKITVHSDGVIVSDPILGFRPKQTTCFHITATRDGQTLHDAEYSIDAYSHRITPLLQQTQKDRAALFFGCSFTFGQGVHDNETLATRFGYHAPCFLPINFGFNGYGPQQMWLQIVHHAADAYKPPAHGVALYTFIDDHTQRLIGTPSVLETWDQPMPWLEIDRQSVQHRGTFQNRSSFDYYINRYLMRSNTFRFFRQYLSPASPDLDSSKSMSFHAQVIDDAARQLWQQYPDYTFAVLLFPGAQTGKQVVEKLRESHIRILDYSDFLPQTGLSPDQAYFRDGVDGGYGHPKPALLDAVAAKLAADLGACR